MPRTAPPMTELKVISSEWITPALIRVNFTSADLSAFRGGTSTDRYVKLLLPGPDGAEVLRTYTALDPDPELGTISIEFVVHGDEGVAGPWATHATAGDRLRVRGPGGAYAPRTGAHWHLLAGDDTAIPAIRQALAALPERAVAEVVVEVEDAEHQTSLPTGTNTTVRWAHRSDTGTLEAAVRAVPWREGVQAFVHGEAGAVMHGVRPYLLQERGVDRADASISGYWRSGRSEEGFRDWKAELASRESVAQSLG